MSSNKEKHDPSFTEVVAKEALISAASSAAVTFGSFAAIYALGWLIQKKNEKNSKN